MSLRFLFLSKVSRFYVFNLFYFVNVFFILKTTKATFSHIQSESSTYTVPIALGMRQDVGQIRTNVFTQRF